MQNWEANFPFWAKVTSVFVFSQDYLDGLDKSKYENDLAEAGNDDAKRKIIQVNNSI